LQVLLDEANKLENIILEFGSCPEIIAENKGLSDLLDNLELIKDILRMKIKDQLKEEKVLGITKQGDGLPLKILLKNSIFLSFELISDLDVSLKEMKTVEFFLQENAAKKLLRQRTETQYKRLIMEKHSYSVVNHELIEAKVRKNIIFKKEQA